MFRMNNKILIIDDDPTVIKLIQSRLEANNFTTAAASNGQEGLEKFKSEKPGLIILDIKMPKMDGYSFVLEFKNIADLATTPIIVLTAYEQMRDIFKFEGINDYLIKPPDMNVLLRKINKHLARPSQKILIVDDEAEFANRLKDQFRKSNYEVITASDGMEGLEKARQESPDLIVLDVMMPKLNGYSVCRILKFDDKYKSIPVIIHTARRQSVDQEISREVGANAYIPKPCTGEVLLDKIKELLWD